MKSFKPIYVTAATIAALSLCACGSSSQQETKQSTAVESSTHAVSSAPALTAAKVGDEVTVSSKNGDLIITVIGVETSEKLRDRFSRSGHVPDGKTVGLLLLTVENVSYNQEGTDRIELDPNVTLVDPATGVTLTPMGTGTSYEDYQDATGGGTRLPVGQKRKVSVPYVVDSSMTKASVHADNTIIDVDVVAK